ncbi:hypothetical protein CSKR_103075 [Clonorchis sinensis]|uniref:Uncharacterized protein n=1 Tax=Clonorchis sinensis TaxID=79923 RepID=A0A3R7JWN7_CLOSI|nr:hypothetical protein CSKR_103075 [Clonorchis sinensis]
MGYRILIQHGNWSRTNQVPPGSQETIFKGLMPCRYYCVSAYAWTALTRIQLIGKGCEQTKVKYLNAIRDFQVTSLASGTEQAVHWKRPAGLSKCGLLHYSLIYRGRNSTTERRWFTSEGPHLISGLQPDAEYYYSVRAYLGELQSSESGWQYSKTNKGLGPPKPYKAQAVPTVGGFRLTWNLPTAESSQRVRKYLVSFGTEAFLFINTGELEYAFTGLPFCQTFNLSLQSVSYSNKTSSKIYECVTTLGTARARSFLKHFSSVHRRSGKKAFTGSILVVHALVWDLSSWYPTSTQQGLVKWYDKKAHTNLGCSNRFRPMTGLIWYAAWTTRTGRPTTEILRNSENTENSQYLIVVDPTPSNNVDQELFQDMVTGFHVQEKLFGKDIKYTRSVNYLITCQTKPGFVLAHRIQNQQQAPVSKTFSLGLEKVVDRTAVIIRYFVKVREKANAASELHNPLCLPAMTPGDSLFGLSKQSRIKIRIPPKQVKYKSVLRKKYLNGVLDIKFLGVEILLIQYKRILRKYNQQKKVMRRMIGGFYVLKGLDVIYSVKHLPRKRMSSRLIAKERLKSCSARRSTWMKSTTERHMVIR